MNAVELRHVTGAKKPPNASVARLGQVSLRNQAVTLGALLPEDVPQVFVWVNDIEAASTDLAFRPLDWSSYTSWLSEMGKNPARVLFAVRTAAEPRIVGFLLLSNIHAVHRSAELGLRIGSKADRGQGYGKAAASLALGYAFDHLNLNRVQLTVLADNAPAIRAYEASGFQMEGRMRRAAFIDGKCVDVLIMAALRPAPRLALV